MNIRIAFRVEEQRDVDLVLAQGALRAGWHAHKLNAPGNSAPTTGEQTESDHAGISPEDSGENPEATLLTALSAAPEEGISVPELVAATGTSRRWIYYRLRELASAGQVIQTTRGQWRTAPRLSRP